MGTPNLPVAFTVEGTEKKAGEGEPHGGRSVGHHLCPLDAVRLPGSGGAWATTKAVGAAKRGVDRTITQARRTVEDTTLKAKSLGQIGVTASLAQLRLDLRTSMRATQQALQDGVRSDPSLKESIGLFERLSAHGRELDDELRRLEQEPDRKRTAEMLPELRERAAKIKQSADSLRWAARERARRFSADELSSLSDQIEVESGGAAGLVA
ncbi:hypothetical protein GCM10020254_55840 [Streptomyces goshikiensis]